MDNLEKICGEKEDTRSLTPTYDKQSRRHKAFIDAYIKNFYNGTQAYLSVYKKASPATAKEKASELVTKGHIQAAIDERSKVLLSIDSVSEEFILNEALKLVKHGKDASKCRMIELLSKIKGMVKENSTQSIAVFNNVPDLAEKRVKRIADFPTAEDSNIPKANDTKQLGTTM